MVLTIFFRQASGVLFSSFFLERMRKDGRAVGLLRVTLLIVTQRLAI